MQHWPHCKLQGMWCCQRGRSAVLEDAPVVWMNRFQTRSGFQRALTRLQTCIYCRVVDNAQKRLWNELMAREHPQVSVFHAEAQVRYLIGSGHGWLGWVFLPRLMPLRIVMFGSAGLRNRDPGT